MIVAGRFLIIQYHPTQQLQVLSVGLQGQKTQRLAFSTVYTYIRPITTTKALVIYRKEASIYRQYIVEDRNTILIFYFRQIETQRHKANGTTTSIQLRRIASQLKAQDHPFQPFDRHDGNPSKAMLSTIRRSLSITANHTRLLPPNLPQTTVSNLPLCSSEICFLEARKLWWCSGYHILSLWPRVLVAVELKLGLPGRSQVRVLPMVFVLLLVGSD